MKTKPIEINNLVRDLLEKIGEQTVFSYVSKILNDELMQLEERISDETNYADENKVGAYRGTGLEARKIANHLKKVKKEQQKLIKMWLQVIKLKQKIEKMDQ